MGEKGEKIREKKGEKGGEERPEKQRAAVTDTHQQHTELGSRYRWHSSRQAKDATHTHTSFFFFLFFISFRRERERDFFFSFRDVLLFLCGLTPPILPHARARSSNFHQTSFFFSGSDWVARPHSQYFFFFLLIIIIIYSLNIFYYYHYFFFSLLLFGFLISFVSVCLP